MAKTVLMVLTSHDKLGNTGEKTGFWIEEFAAPYYAFKDAGIQISIASPKGGQPPIDPKSAMESNQTDATRRFDGDTEAKDHLAASLKLAEVRAEDYDAIFFPGGHGPLWDLVSDENSIRLIEAFWAAGKPVASVCHAPIVLANAKDNAGNYIVKGREVTGFTNSEEAAVGLTDVVPLLVEDTLIDRGGRFSKVEDWAAYSVADGMLITGQNPASSEEVAHRCIKAIG